MTLSRQDWAEQACFEIDDVSICRFERHRQLTMLGLCRRLHHLKQNYEINVRFSA